MQLIAGTDSTWSLRVWMCLQLVNVKAPEHIIDLSSEDYKSKILAYSPTGLVPALIDGTVIMHDSFAITEYLNEQYRGGLYPDSVKQRALARSLCAEMHSGFMLLREHCPFTLETAEQVTLTEELKAEVSRIQSIFESAEMPYMFEFPGAVDAFYAILAFRLESYGIKLIGKAGMYQQHLLKWSLLEQAIAQAKHWEKVAV